MVSAKQTRAAQPHLPLPLGSASGCNPVGSFLQLPLALQGPSPCPIQAQRTQVLRKGQGLREPLLPRKAGDSAWASAVKGCALGVAGHCVACRGMWPSGSCILGQKGLRWTQPPQLPAVLWGLRAAQGCGSCQLSPKRDVSICWLPAVTQEEPCHLLLLCKAA